MTCVLGMVVTKRTGDPKLCKDTVLPGSCWYRIWVEKPFDGEWRAVEGSAYYQSPLLYKENGFKEEEDAKALIHKSRKPWNLRRRSLSAH